MVKKTFNPPVLQAVRLDLVKVICVSDPTDGNAGFDENENGSDVDDQSNDPYWW